MLPAFKKFKKQDDNYYYGTGKVQIAIIKNPSTFFAVYGVSDVTVVGEECSTPVEALDNLYTKLNTLVEALT